MAIRTIIHASVLAALGSASAAQVAVDWTQTTEPPGFWLFFDAVTDSSGATYMISNIRTGPGPGDIDVGVTRMNSDGTAGWNAQYAGPEGQDVATAIAMSWDESAVYGLGRSSVPGFGNSDFAILKYDAATGAPIWTVLYDGGDLGIDSPRDIAGTPDGGVVATGGIDTPNEQRDFGTAKFDADGNVLWERKYTGQYIFLFENDDSYFVTVTPEGDVVISGAAVSFDREAIVTIKYDGETGETLWEGVYNSAMSDWPRGLAIAPDGDVVVFGSDPFGLDRQWVVVSYDGQTGAEQWVTLVDPGFDESERAMIVGADGTVYTTGATDPDGDDSNANQNLIAIAYEGETGAVRWITEFGDLGNGDGEYGSGLFDDGAGSLYVVGATSSDSLVSNPFDTDGLLLRLDTASGQVQDIQLIDTTPAGGPIVAENFRRLGFDAPGNVYAIGTASGSSESALLVTRFATAICVGDLAPPFGSLDFSDVAAFLTAFGQSDPSADLAAPIGSFDFTDVSAFLAAFGAGCP